MKWEQYYLELLVETTACETRCSLRGARYFNIYLSHARVVQIRISAWILARAWNAVIIPQHSKDMFTCATRAVRCRYRTWERGTFRVRVRVFFYFEDSVKRGNVVLRWFRHQLRVLVWEKMCKWCAHAPCRSPQGPGASTPARDGLRKRRKKKGWERKLNIDFKKWII